jgi:hypothetical protein
MSFRNGAYSFDDTAREIIGRFALNAAASGVRRRIVVSRSQSRATGPCGSAGTVNGREG